MLGKVILQKYTNIVMKLKFVAPLSLLAVVGCSSEYTPEELEVSSKGAFVERGTNSLIDGTFLVEKVTGESLTVQFENGLPFGSVEMRDEKGGIILRSNFVNREKKKSLDSEAGFVNQILRDASALATEDYLDLFEDFAEYNGEYYEKDSKQRKVEGLYAKGEKIGRWQEYCENKQLESDRSYKEFNEGGNLVIKKIGKEQQFTCEGDVLLSANRDNEGRLQGEYIENYSNRSFGTLGDKNELPDKPKQKYIRNYKDGKFDGFQKEFSNIGLVVKESNYKNGNLDGLQKEHDQHGQIRLESNYKKSIKHGEEKVYLTSQDYTTKEITHWLSEVKNFSDGILDGNYQQLDYLDRSLQSGVYQGGNPVGLWEINNYTKSTKTISDYDANNFTLDKSKPFKEACFLPTHYLSIIDWSKKRATPLKDCEYYVEKGLVDINKKIALDQNESFKKSSHWTYPAIVATPAVYDYMKSRGLKTHIADSVGRTRLHYCILQFRSQSSNSLRCDMNQVITYMDDVDLDSVSNIGTLFHQLAQPYRSIRKKELAALVESEKKITKALIQKGANINQLNHQGKTALMTAIENENYYIAEYLIDEGASVDGKDSAGKNVLGHFFLSSNNKLTRSELSADATRVLAKAIALGVSPNATVLGDKTIQNLSEENNKIFHIQTLKNATTISLGFSEELKNRPQIAAKKQDIKKVASQSEFIEAKKSLLSDSTGSENTVDQVKLLEQPKEEVRSNVEYLLSEEAKNTERPDDDEHVAKSDEVAKLLQEQANFLVTQANEHIANFRLKTPKNNSALDSLEQLKKIDSENENISVIEKNIGEKYLSLTANKIKEGQKSAAQNHLNSASEFIDDEAVLVDYQARVEATKKHTPPPKTTLSSTITSAAVRTNIAPIACDPVVSFSGVPLIGGQSFTAKQSLPISPGSALEKSARAVRLTYNRVVASGNQITYEQATSTKPIKFTLTVIPSGNFSQISIKAKTPTGIVLKKSGYKKGFCDLLEKF